MRRVLLALVLMSLAATPSATAAGRATPEVVPGAEDLAFPANFAIAPDGRIFLAEKDTGDVRIIQDGRLLPHPFFHVDAEAGSETGLLGIALHPDFATHPWVYLYYSDAVDRRNRLIRVLADGDRSADVQDLIDGLTTVNGYHNGGDIVFGTDGTLFLSLGEAHEPDRAQDPNDIGGKIVRIEADGNLPPDNPFGPDNPVYSIGHRNSFGLCVDPATGDLWETENGPSSDDEVNRIVAGGNYGWPDQLGPGGGSGLIDPVVDYRAIIVPTGCAIWDGDLYVGSYATGLVHRISLPADPGRARDEVVARLEAPITDLEVGPDGALYASTTTAIYRLAAGPSPMPSIAVPSPTALPPRPGDDGGRTAARWIAAIAALAAGGGLALRLRAGRRLRRDLEGAPRS